MDNPEHYLVGYFTNMSQAQEWINANYNKGWILTEFKPVPGFAGPHSASGSGVYVVLEWQVFAEDE